VVTLARRIFVPTVLLALIVAIALAYTAWDSVQQASALERDTRAIRAATSLAAALDDATEEEERWILSIPLSPREPYEERLAETGERIAAVMQELGALQMPPRAAAVWRLFLEARPSLAGFGSEVVTAARSGDPARLSLAVEKWRLMSSRADALLLNFSTYYLRLLDRRVAELQERRARALRTAAAAVGAGLLAAVALSAAVARAVVRPIVRIASAAERVAETGRLAEVAGADRRDELGVLARAFNRMTQRLTSANAHLEAADRRKDNFLAMLSHELRNPLAPIRNAIAVLTHAGADPPRTRRALAVIERQVEHLTRILDDLLDVTRIARGKIELRRALLNVTALVGRVCEDHRSFLAEGGLALELELDGAAGAAWVDADGTRLAQVIGNLLHNAAKFTPRGGRVSVAVEVHGDEVEVRVTDTGIGMDEGLLRRIFEPFVQADGSLARTGGGLGLGLALVRGVVELHGGAVEARSAGDGAGSEFVLRLPLAAPPAAPPRERSPEKPRVAARRVLVIDDNVDAATTLAELVTLFGHATTVAHDGPSAIALARQDPPDVVLCDIGLPGMSGFEVAQALRAEGGPGPYLVAVSGYAQPEDVQKAIAAGFDRHLAKPPQPGELERLLAAAGRRGAPG
jgi:signal transduction histidine kinase/ActR/RegA family two-component response regulator